MIHKKIFLFVFLALHFTIIKAQGLLQPVWESTNLAVPESVLYSEEEQKLYVSLVDGAGNVKDGRGGVAILNTDGTIKNAKLVENLNAPKGLAKFKNTIFVADLTTLISIDIRSGNIIDRIEIDSAVFLNDVAVDKDGMVYVSDTRANKIYRVKNGHAEVFLRNVPNANGLKWINAQLFVLANNELWKIDGKKNKTIVARGFEKGGDGLEQLANGDFIVTCWAGLIYYVEANGEIRKIMDVQGKMNTADLGYNKIDGMLYIPTFNSNKVVAYKVH
jgi:hypothetical protein